MMDNIEKLSTENDETPLALKLGEYRRNLMLMGIDKLPSASKERGQ
jgi:hypothetical protein|tara:strand:+ start:841 stop:978 length:138 start_codon:yes stop_codon:yes gene_type:complete